MHESILVSSQERSDTKIGIMVCGHGSRSVSAIDQFSNVVSQLKSYFPSIPLEFGYLEFSNPVIRDGLDKLREHGCNHILAIPGMLFAAMHAKNDIPSVLNNYSKLHNIKIEYGRDLGIDSNLIEAASDRINECITEANDTGLIVNKSETCLVVIGRGSSDPDANSNISLVARLIMEKTNLGCVEVGYSGVTFPLVKPCLEHVAKLGFKRIIVFPYFLFTGILIDRIYGFTDMVAKDNDSIQFLKAGYFNNHPKLLETFANRVIEILNKKNIMNCDLCKYKEIVLGFESEVGTPQQSHHHHVEGQGATAPGSNISDCVLCDKFCTGMCRLEQETEHFHHKHGNHSHGHHHPIYPKADHPLGPKSVRELKDNN